MGPRREVVARGRVELPSPGVFSPGIQSLVLKEILAPSLTTRRPGYRGLSTAVARINASAEARTGAAVVVRPPGPFVPDEGLGQKGRPEIFEFFHERRHLAWRLLP